MERLADGHNTGGQTAEGIKSPDGTSTKTGADKDSANQAANAPTYSIADLAREFDVTPRTLRYYEDEGLVTPARCGQTRIYSHTDKVRLGWIMRGKRVGFSIADIKEMLALYNVGDNRETQRLVTLEKCRARLTDLEAQRNDLDRLIAELSQFAEALETIERDPLTGRWIDPTTGRPPTRVNLSTTGPQAPNPIKKA